MQSDPERLGMFLRPRNTVLLLLIVPFIAFLPVLNNGFVEWDDPALVLENPAVQSINPHTLRTIFTTYDPELYVPVTLLSYQLDHLIGGLEPFFYHLDSLLLHIGNVLLVFWLLLLLTKNKIAAFTGALLFAVHPLNVETVAWVSARKDLLSTTFFLLSIVTYLRSRNHRRTLFFILSIAAFALGLMAKVMVVTLPLILLLIDWRERRTDYGKLLTEKIPYVALALLFGSIAVIGKQAFFATASPFDSILIGARSTLFYLQKIILPLGLSVLYPFTDDVSVMSPLLLGSLAAVIALTAAVAYAGYRGYRDVVFGWALFLVCLAPTFLLYRRGEHLGDIYFASDRYVYAAGIGLFFLAGLGVAFLVRRFDEERVLMVTGLAVLVLAGLSFFQSTTWHDTESLFFHVLRYYPNSHVARLNIGNYYQRLGNYERAFEQYKISLYIRPTSLAFFNIGKAQLDMKNYDAAILANEEALRLDAASKIAWLNLGVAYVRKEMWKEAEESFRGLLMIDPDSVEGHFNLAVVFEKQRKNAEAAKEYERAIALNPGLLQARQGLARVRP